MPQASDRQRELMERWFGDSINMAGPYKFLRSHGYTEKGGLLIKPVSAHNVSRDEWQCIRFLVDEWDFGFDPRMKNDE